MSEDINRIYIGTPVYKELPVEFVGSIQRLISMPGFGFATNYHKSCLIHNGRTRIAEAFVNGKHADMFKYILWIDSDMVFTENDFLTLFEHIQKPEVDIVGGMYSKRQSPYNINAGYCNKKTKWRLEALVDWGEELMEVDYLGMGFVLMTQDIFKKMKKPWFEYRKYKSGDTLGEDVTFCLKAKEAGFKVWLDPNVQLGHMGEYMYTPLDFLAIKEAQKDEHTIKGNPTT